MNGNRLFLAVPGDRTSVRWRQLQHRKFHTNMRRTFLLWGLQSTGTGCWGKLWSLLFWRYSKPTWMLSWAICYREPALAGGWTWWSLEDLSNPCNCVIQYSAAYRFRSRSHLSCHHLNASFSIVVGWFVCFFIKCFPELLLWGWVSAWCANVDSQICWMVVLNAAAAVIICSFSVQWKISWC